MKRNVAMRWDFDQILDLDDLIHRVSNVPLSKLLHKMLYESRVRSRVKISDLVSNKTHCIRYHNSCL